MLKSFIAFVVINFESNQRLKIKIAFTMIAQSQRKMVW